MKNNYDELVSKNIYDYLLQLGDDRLILGHRVSEWCGHAPILEEDIALANISLDLIGQSSFIYKIACEIEAKNRTEDDLAFYRAPNNFKCIEIVELPKGDFAFTIVRQLFFSLFNDLTLNLLSNSHFIPLAEISLKAVKESAYHTRHSKEWIKRLGNGTEESHRKIQIAVDELWKYTFQMFEESQSEKLLIEKGIISDTKSIKSDWLKVIEIILTEANIKIPEVTENHLFTRTRNFHTEHLSHLLAEMQSVPRSYPNLKW